MSAAEIVIAGAGGFALEVEDYVADCAAAGMGLLDADGAPIRGLSGAFVSGVLDPGAGRLADFAGTPTHYADEDGYDPGDRWHVIAIGDPRIRARIAARLIEKDARFVSLIHPSAKIAATASIGTGCIVGPFGFIGPRVRLGDHVVFNTYSSAGHDGTVGDFSVLSPYAVLNGHATLGTLAFMGSGALITPGKSVGARCWIAAGSVVYHNFDEGLLLRGNPATGQPSTR